MNRLLHLLEKTPEGTDLLVLTEEASIAQLVKPKFSIHRSNVRASLPVGLFLVWAFSKSLTLDCYSGFESPWQRRQVPTCGSRSLRGYQTFDLRPSTLDLPSPKGWLSFMRWCVIWLMGGWCVNWLRLTDPQPGVMFLTCTRVGCRTLDADR